MPATITKSASKSKSTTSTADRLKMADFASQLAAISKTQAVIEFNLDGTIVTANENFLQTTGYSLSEIEGRHHSLFCEDNYKHSPEYREFWAKLNRGEFLTGEFKRVGKGGKEIWIQASYSPLFDEWQGVQGCQIRDGHYHASEITKRCPQVSLCC